MATVQLKPWSLRQRFTWRASTLLLTYVGALYVAGIINPLFPLASQSTVEWVVGKLGPGSLMVWLPAAIFALAFFIASVWRRNPQLQFLLELIVALAIVLLTPTY